jgi:thioredoxin reductase (NADPH)
LPDEDRLIGRGISYCATCDAMFFRSKTVGVVGGSDAANTAALYLADIADKVYQIYRGRELRGETAWIEQIQANPKIITLFETNITKLLGQNRLEAVELDRPYEGVDRLALEGLFVEIGSDPDRTLSDALGLTIDDKGYIVTAPDQKTSRDGVWAAGDITTNSDGFRQIVTACSEGAIAAHSIHKYLMAKKA